MKIVLKHDWDVPISPPDIIEGQDASRLYERQELGHYGGRTDELNKIVNELLRRPKGSILISGYRGVGKTSFIYKALSELKIKNNDIIIVMLNAAQLEIEPNKGDLKSVDKLDPRKILENLIRRLYSTSKETNLDSEIKKEINLLYKTAVAVEANITERYQNQKDFRQTKINQKIFNFSIDSQKSILALTGILALAFQYINIFQLEWINKIMPICIALLMPMFIYNHLNIEQEDEVIAKNADETYRLDNCIGNLEFDLEKIHKDIYQINNKKIIYVIDELDKLGLESNNSKIVDEILNYLKNFFTLSNAIFIFIGDEKLYDSYDLNGEKKSQAINNTDDRKRNYTYFTSKYFISRPLWSDLDFYFLEIFKETDITDSELSVLKRALCFEARNDFFDIKKFINDRITSFNEENEPIIELVDSYEDVLKSRFHKVITLLFDEKYRSKYPTKWRENERLIKKLFEHAYSIFKKDVGETFEDLKDDSVDSQMTRDFNGFLESLGALRMEKETTIQLRGINVPIRTYWYSGDIPTEPPMHLSEATEFEKRYIYNFELFLKYSKAIIWAFETARGLEEHQILPHMEESDLLINRLKELGYNIQNFYEVNLKIYNNIINKKEIYPYRREDIEKKTKDLEKQIEYMFLNLPQFISKMVIASKPDILLKTMEKKNDVFNIIPEEYRDKFFGGHVIEEPESLKQILLVNGKEVFLRKIDNILGENSLTHMIVCIKKIKGEEPGKFYRVISAATPRDLRESLISFLLDVNGFLKPEKLHDATINDTK